MSEPQDTPARPVLVTMTVPADVSFVSTLRLAAAGLGSRCDLTVDDIEDLRLAVDEACSLLLPHAGPDSVLEARFELGDGRLSVTSTVGTVSAATLDRAGFAWTVLGALASTIDVAQSEQQLAITVVKQREAAQT